MVYNMYEFWNKKKNPNKRNQSEDLNNSHREYIKKNVKDDIFILDYGPGIGRTLTAFNIKQVITGVDISLTYRDKIIEEAKKLNLNFKWMHIGETQIKHLPFSDNQFDAVVCSQVLMHQTPHIIIPVMKELRRVGKKVVVNTAHATNNRATKPIKEERQYKVHLFRYNFYNIAKQCGFEIFNDVIINPKHMSFCYK